jgi:hypothetical protein
MGAAGGAAQRLPVGPQVPADAGPQVTGAGRGPGAQDVIDLLRVAGSPRTRANVAASGRRGRPAASRGAPSRCRTRAGADAAHAAAPSGLSSPAAPAATATAVR